MAYNYIGLVNDINRRLNEVELNSDNFSTATGFYSFAKDAVNAAIRHINQEEFEWPWNHVEQTEDLTAGVVRYGYPGDLKTLNMNSVRIKRDASLNVTTTRLKPMSYEEWVDKYADSEYNTDTSIRTTPTHVVRTPSREYIVHPSPDQDYEIVYEYYRLGFDMDRYNDVPSLPEQYRYVIVDGAMYYVYQFRGDMQAASLAFNKFGQGIKHLRSQHINRTEYLRDTRVHF